MSVPDCVPTFACLTDINTQLSSQCHWHNKPKDKNAGKRCGNSVSVADAQKRRILIGTLRGLIPSANVETKASSNLTSSSGSTKIQELLRELSELLLCKRYHRVESTSIYRKWSTELEQLEKSSSSSLRLEIREELRIEDIKMQLCQGKDSNWTRCMNRINAAKLKRASAIIDNMADSRDVLPTTQDDVMVVTQLLICQQHQVQVIEKAEEWFKRIQKLFPPADPPLERRRSGSRPSNTVQPSSASQPSTPFSRTASAQKLETPESAISNVRSRADSTTISTPTTKHPSQRRCDFTSTSHGSPRLSRRATTTNNTNNVSNAETIEPQRVPHSRITRSTAGQYERGYQPPAPILPCFQPFCSPNKNTFLKDLYTKITSPITPTQKRNGYVYGFQRKGEKYIKIGYTGGTVQSRLQVWERLCHQKIAVVFEEHVLHPFRVESLVHLTLYRERRREIHCKGCQKSHVEWFEVTLERAKYVLGMWKRWIETEPFDKEGNLKPIWIKHIDGLRMNKVNISLESWRDWIDIDILTKSTTVEVKKEFLDDRQAVTPAAKMKTNIHVAEPDVKGEAEVKELNNLRSLRRNFLESILELKVEIPDGKLPNTYRTASSRHIDDPFAASPVTAVVA